jgi:hypothetical protein
MVKIGIFVLFTMVIGCTGGYKKCNTPKVWRCDGDVVELCDGDPDNPHWNPRWACEPGRCRIDEKGDPWCS